MKEKFGVEHKSPRPTFNESFEQGLTTEDETKKLLDMIEDRNNTSHAYIEEYAEAVSERAKDHLKVLQAVFERIIV